MAKLIFWHVLQRIVGSITFCFMKLHEILLLQTLLAMLDVRMDEFNKPLDDS